MQTLRIISVLDSLRKYYHTKTMLATVGRKENPFSVLISTVLSARAKDITTLPIAERLLEKYRTPRALAHVPLKQLQKEIHSIGFYKQKAKRLIGLSKILQEKHGGKVPRDIDQLLELPGVGRKTANCVLVYAFRKPAIPVDTHVHRVSNRLGFVRTRKPEETETALLKIVPKSRWIDINELFVTHGQTTCTPVAPFCSKCPIRKICKRVGVTKSR